ncbi:MAG: VCBS repeat-containing protein [Flavobacteriaceae bacterium]|nr:VCBS repeat-containing protein [Flavobacteriaceae bacterium]
MKKTLTLFLTVNLGLFVLNAQVSSDSCAEADIETPITTFGTYTVDQIDGNMASPDANCGNSESGADKSEWYRFIPTSNTSVTISSNLPQNIVSDNYIDTQVKVFEGSCDALICVASNDDAAGRSSEVTFQATHNTTYYIVWDNRWDPRGFDFELTESNTQLVFNSENLSFFDGEQESCIVDMNNDFLDDIVRVSDNQINISFQNPDGSFTEETFDPTIIQQNVPDWSIAAGDLNNDGYNDLLLAGAQRVTFVYNNNGTSFTADNSQTDYIFSQRSTFADINNDGHLDAFVCHDVDQSHPYLNDGMGNLTLDKTLIETANLSGNYSAIWIDYDNDRDNDLYITKCKQGSAHGDIERTNLMYRNNGDGSYTEVAGDIGLADNAQSWSTVFEDLDNDGDLDAFVVNHSGGPIAANRYYKNELIETGTATFTDIINDTGIPSDDLGAWENVAGDFDNDGYIDIFSELSKEMYLNNGNNTFTGENLDFDEGAIGDIDNDGDLDVVQKNKLYRNNTLNDNNWFKLNTIGVASNKNGIGSRVEITGAFGIQIREVRSGEGFSHMNSLTTHFGLGTNTAISALTIYWPSGTIDIIFNPDINDTLTVVEGETLSLQKSLSEDLIIYPNPTKQYLNLNSTRNLNGALYTVFSASGKRVLNNKLQSNKIDVSQLSSGYYILRLMHEGAIKSQKFIKQ